MERFIKPSIALGALSGLVFGILLLMPFIAPFMFFFMFILAGIIVIVALKKTNTAGVITLQNGSIIGALTGFFSLIAASIFYIPIAYLIDIIFNKNPDTFRISTSFSMNSYDLMAISMLIFFTAVLSAITNAFTAMVTAFIYEKIENKKTSFEDHLYMGQFDEKIE